MQFEVELKSQVMLRLRLEDVDAPVDCPTRIRTARQDNQARMSERKK